MIPRTGQVAIGMLADVKQATIAPLIRRTIAKGTIFYTPVNTIEGFWSLLRSWLRPHRGISPEKLPLDLGFFEFVHNVRRRGKALLGAVIDLLVTPTPRNAG